MKSHVSNLLRLAELVYQDVSAFCTADVSDLRDLLTLRSRVKHEGLSFLTITLGDFCKDFESALESSFIDPTLFRNFRKTGSIPAFLQGMIGRVFDKETGRMISHEAYHRDYENPTNSRRIPENVGVPWRTCRQDCRQVQEETRSCKGNSCSFYRDRSAIVGAVRQFCRFFTKIKLDCTPERVAAAFQNFKDIELENRGFGLDETSKAKFASASFFIWAPILSSVLLDKLRFAHGPGATAEGISGNRKFSIRAWPDWFEPYFPLIDSAFVFSAIDSEEVQTVTIRASKREVPVKVIPVPKTLRSPRIIAIEPVAMQYAQQALRSELYARIENYPLTKGHVVFTDQTVNQRLAMTSSKNRSYATLDLKDASDRVLRSLALDMFEYHPDLKDAILACTSDFAKLPDGQIIGPLEKFSSMGNALCFPVEAMLFYTICVIARLDKYNLPYSFRNVKRVARRIFVYGDDLIVPRRDADTIRDYLHRYNCKVNTRKSFSSGYFRESCGMDAYGGTDVTPVYLRELPPSNRRQAEEIVSITETARHCYKRCLWKTSEFLFRQVEKILGPLPYVEDTSPLLGRTSFRGYRSFHRWNFKLHRFECFGTQAVPVYRTDRLSGYAALTKSLGVVGSKEPIDPKHLQRSALYGAVALQRRWAPA